MVNKRFICVTVLQSTIILLLLFFLFGGKAQKEKNSISIVALNRITNENLQKVIEHFIDTTKNRSYNFVVVYDISDHDGASYCITYINELDLISNDLCLNVICEKIKGKEVIFRPINYTNGFVKSVDTILVHYLMKYNPDVANSLKELIVINSMQEDRDIINVTGPIIPKVIVSFNKNGSILDVSYHNL